MPQKESPLLKHYLEANIGGRDDQPIVPRPSKPMFAPKGGEVSRSRVSGPLELNKHHQDYNMLHPDVRRDINFSSYLDLLGLKGGSHGH